MQIYLHGNNLSTLHEHLPTDILPAELGGTGPAFNPGLWAEPVINSAMKEAELAAAKGKEDDVDENMRIQEPANLRDGSEIADGNHDTSNGSNILTKLQDGAKTSLNTSGSNAKHSVRRANVQMDVELNVISRKSNRERDTTGHVKNDENSAEDISERIGNKNVNGYSDNRIIQSTTDDSEFFDAESDAKSNDFEIIPNGPGSESSKDSSLDNRSVKALIVAENSEIPSEETNLIT